MKNLIAAGLALSLLGIGAAHAYDSDDYSSYHHYDRDYHSGYHHHYGYYNSNYRDRDEWRHHYGHHYGWSQGHHYGWSHSRYSRCHDSDHDCE
ncbi:MAG TPA: hypothetical protein VGH02_14055 [Rhizomicrobium sp.]